MEKEYLTYNRECGFNIVKAESEQEAEGFDCVALDETHKVDSKIIDRIRQLIEVE